MLREILKLVRSQLKPIENSVKNIVSRAIVDLVDDSLKTQTMQIVVLDGEVRSDVERFQQYGFTSVPVKDAEAVVLFPGGHRDHGLILGVEDRRYRVKGLANGEVAVYDKVGSKIVLKSSGDIEITPWSGVVSVSGDLNVSGIVSGADDVVGGGKSLKEHMHTVAGANSGGPVVFTPTPGLTGAPS